MNKWLQSRTSVKRLYIIAGGAAMVLLAFAFATLFIKPNNVSPSNGQSATNTPLSKTENATSSKVTETGVVLIPLNKTLDEAKAEGLYSEPGYTVSSSSASKEQNDTKTSQKQREANASYSSSVATSSGVTPANPGQQAVTEASAAGQGLDANTINQLRSYGIREGDLAKIDRMVAEGIDPKEIAHSLRKNGNPNLAAVMEQVPRKPKKEKKSKEEEKEKKDVSATDDNKQAEKNDKHEEQDD
ncbi:hypothetical protein P4S83_07130 [Aneurinibacillus thermoaerophilus]|uniref:hypothetical protein n=1 Tax=Aneurinibacillus thermoaerophilus TaxID=143495 RepID=UPI002E234F11|nr:hypothetical protein [Aneurinibacillus thermoaerophilus]MED0764207.1 hypothetical protein [Aneurinibacillus thermoaerophilus]